MTFDFIGAWPEVRESADKAAGRARSDPRSACFYARRAVQLAVRWMYKYDPALRLPYQDRLGALIHEPSFKDATAPAIFAKIRLVADLGNLALHSRRMIREDEALTAVRELFHVAYWLAKTYSTHPPPADLVFEPDALARAADAPRLTREQLTELEATHEAEDEDLVALLEGAQLDEELRRVRAEIAKAKKAAEVRPDQHDYSEAETRAFYIDLLLKEAGWDLVQARDREFPVVGMPTSNGKNDGQGFVDYVLWSTDDKPLGLVEAKRTTRDSRVGKQQAKLYADCLEKAYGERPIIFCSNGYEHWIWDDLSYPPRATQGFYTKDELELRIQRRSTRTPLAGAEPKRAIVDRHYQFRAIRRVAEVFERDNQRTALLVMATGAGKTRTVVALTEMLGRCQWIKRVLFLADRRPLVKQAVGAFKRHLPDYTTVNLITREGREEMGRVYVSTYPTMMGLIDVTNEGRRRFGVGYFDMVVIDEAHRSVFQKYRAILDYFDAFLVGLTATPKDEVDKNTYKLLGLESGVPTDSYELKDAIQDGFLVPYKPVSVPLKFIREGIAYDELPEDEKDEWDALDWGEEEPKPERVDPAAINKWLFNTDTVDKVLEHLMTRGQRVAGGDRLGKTIIFAKNQEHAKFIEERFNANYPRFRGKFARVITHEMEYAQSLIDDFSLKDKAPHVAISVDMLDTGIDIPEVVNLVFFKPVHSKTKFWQMLGRGTRLCPDLFGPGEDKKFFYIFDYCQNLEFFFGKDPETTEGDLADSLSTRLFRARLDLIRELDRKGVEIPAEAKQHADPETDGDVRVQTAAALNAEVATMDRDSFVVRPKRQLVERYADADAWSRLTAEDYATLSKEVAPLPSEQQAEAEEAKRFDLLVYQLQLALLRGRPTYLRLRGRVQEIAALLEEKEAIPAVRLQMELIQDLQSDEWWQDVTLPMLEGVRRRLRELVRFIDKAKRKSLVTDFEDELGKDVVIEVPKETSTPGLDLQRFQAKARVFLRGHLDHIAIRKLRMNKPLTQQDLDELGRMLVEAGIGTSEDVSRAAASKHGLGLFVRSLVGLDREAAKAAFAEFIDGERFSAQQIEFVDLIIDHLTEHGAIDESALYDSPFTDVAPRGPEGLFMGADVGQLIAVLRQVRMTAAELAA